MNKLKYEKHVRELYALDCNIKRKEFLDELFLFMFKRGTSITSIPTFGKEVADIFALFNAVVKHEGILEVMNNKLWQTICEEIGISYRGAPSLEMTYIQNLYPMECEKHRFSTPTELSATIDSKSSDDEIMTMSDDEKMTMSDDENMPVDPSTPMELETFDPSKLEQMSAEDLEKQMEKYVNCLQTIENKSDSIKKVYNIDNNPERKIFLDELLEFMDNRKTPIKETPYMEGRQIDLYELYTLVVDTGGLEEVNHKKFWSTIAKKLKITKYSFSINRLRSIYSNILYPFECEKEGFSSLCIKIKGDIDSLYSIDNDPKRKDFLDCYFLFMIKKGFPMIVVPFIKEQVLDLFKLYTLVVENNGLVNVLYNHLFKSIAPELKLITNSSIIYRLRQMYTYYLYDYECEMKGFSTIYDLEKCFKKLRINKSFTEGNLKKFESRKSDEEDGETDDEDYEKVIYDEREDSECGESSTESDDEDEKSEDEILPIKSRSPKLKTTIVQLYKIDNDPNRKVFLDELLLFMNQRGTPINMPQIIFGQLLDLYKLYSLVVEREGFLNVIANKLWPPIAEALEIGSMKSCASYWLKDHYQKMLYPFECHKEGFNTNSQQSNINLRNPKDHEDQVTIRISVDGLNYEGVLRVTPFDGTKQHDITISAPGLVVRKEQSDTTSKNTTNS